MPESPHMLEIPSFLRKRNELGGGCGEPIPASLDNSHKVFHQQVRGSSARMEIGRSASHPRTSMALELHSTPNSVQEERGEVGLSHFILFALFIFPPFDSVLLHHLYNCLKKKKRRRGLKTNYAVASTTWSPMSINDSSITLNVIGRLSHQAGGTRGGGAQGLLSSQDVPAWQHGLSTHQDGPALVNNEFWCLESSNSLDG